MCRCTLKMSRKAKTEIPVNLCLLYVARSEVPGGSCYGLTPLAFVAWANGRGVCHPAPPCLSETAAHRNGGELR